MDFRGVIDQWPTPSAKTLAGDIGAPEWRVSKWRTRNNIPPDYWHDILGAAERRDIRITAQDLAWIAKSVAESKADGKRNGNEAA